jgi:hypothetical protein
MEKTTIGHGKPVIGIVACLHGNERIGCDIVEYLKDVRFKKGTLDLIIANEEAMQQNKRYIDADLNRCFPGNLNGDYEEKLAAQLTKELAGCDHVIDIHSTTAETDDFIVITKEHAKRLAGYMPLSKVVFMEPAVAKGKALIDHAGCGISIEFDRRTEARYAFGKVSACLINLGVLDGGAEKTNQQYYSVYGVMKKRDIKLVNFKETTIDSETFYPVLYGEEAYKDLLCLKARSTGWR